MYNKLGIYASVLVLSAMALFWSGCSECRNDTNTPVMEQQTGPELCASRPCPPPCPPKPCPPPCPPKCPPPCPPAPSCIPCLEEPLCKIPAKCCYPSSNELCCRDGITVSARNPKVCMLGDQYPLEIDIHACDDVCDVVVTTNLPEGVSFVRSQPEGKVEGKKVTWNIGAMKKGQCIAAKVWLKCECEGELCACFCATATPVRFCSLLCAKPLLVCEKCGTAEACPGDPIHYTISVLNRGSATAEDVVITDNLPSGVEHASGNKTLVYKLGCLAPCECKKVDLCVTACKRGKVCNTAVVTACNADTTSCQWCTNVCKLCIDLLKNGPKEQTIGKNADYQITVINPGDKPLTDLVITDQAPSATSIVAANGAKINGNQAVWRMRELKPGEKANFTLTLTTCTPGCFTNKVHVTNCQRCEACAEATTRWKGRPEINACINQNEGSICVGDTVSYRVNVFNQGTEADNNVVVTVRFPEQLQPVAGTGPTKATVSGQTVTFAPVNNFTQRQSLEYRVEARAKSSGDARVNIDVTSDTLRTPLTQQESTIVN